MALKMRKFGEWLRGIREERGYSLNGAAEFMGFDPAYLSRVENGKVPASLRLISGIAEALGVSLFDLLTRSRWLKIKEGIPEEQLSILMEAINSGLIEISNPE
jgi:transcriptional regulator with XRE-family HTH domain